MSRRPSSLFARLRRHRGLWVLAMAVLLIKLTSSTLCMTDGIGFQARAAAAATHTTVPVAAAEHPPEAGEAGCILGEGSTCHCACAHAATLPAARFVAAAYSAANLPPALLLPDAVPGAPASLLRPPIA